VSGARDGSGCKATQPDGTWAQVVRLLGPTVLAVACSGGSQNGFGDGSVDGSAMSEAGPADAGGDTDTDTGPKTVDNVAPLTLSNGPDGDRSENIPYVTITLCVPGTTSCQTIEDVAVDTGSSGVRIVASALSSISLPAAPGTGGTLVECGMFGSGYTWGSVRLADVKVAGEVAARIPIQLVGDPEFPTVPSECSDSGPPLDTQMEFDSNGLFGINQIIADCGEACIAPNPTPGAYYGCTGSTCSVAAVPVAQQISNPIASFSSDNNGSVLEFPSVGPNGSATLNGKLIFGIGTQDNNALGDATVLTTDTFGNFSTQFDGQVLSESFIDSGTNFLAFNDGSIPACSEPSFLFCPNSTLSLSAVNVGLNGTHSTVSFTVANALNLLEGAPNSAFDNIAGPGFTGSFDWGLPFFLGRNVFVALQGASTPGGKGPYFAY
jgi:hypothetical protein